MWLKILVPLLAIGYIGYKVAVAREISRARGRGDAARVEQLTGNGLGFRRFVLGTVIAAICVLVLIAVIEIR